MIKTGFSPAQADLKINCTGCGSADSHLMYAAGDYEYGLPGQFYVSRCQSCGLISQNPRPPFSQILHYYTEEYEPYSAVGSKIMQAARYLLLVRPRLRKYQALFKNLTGPINVLDVGCGSGDLLNELSFDQKFDCVGIEPVENAADIAREKGIKVITGLVENHDFQGEQFDLIIMNHVLEHLPNPEEVIGKVYELLRPGGYLIGELPCSEAVERHIFGRYWGMYHLPRHLTFFSRRLLGRFLERFGFTEIKISLQPVPSAWQASVRNYLLSKNISKKIVKMFSGHSVVLNILSYPYAVLSVCCGYSSIQHFIANKTDGVYQHCFIRPETP